MECSDKQFIITFAEIIKDEMAIYFCFSDESGAYQAGMSESKLKVHPFYVRSTLIINAEDWKLLNDYLNKRKNELGFPTELELKWSALHDKKNDAINKESLKIYIHDCLEYLSKLPYKKIILTATKNDFNKTYSDYNILKYHLQNSMQRIQLELHGNEDNLAILFIDPVNSEKDKMLREVYHEIYLAGDYIEKYSSIKDSLNIEFSHHSVGIQIADYIAGIFHCCLKSQNGNYQFSLELYDKFIKPHLRQTPYHIFGYGIVEIPTHREHRSWFIEQLNSLEVKNLQ